MKSRGISKRISLVVVACMLLAILAACSGSGMETPTTSAASSTSNTEDNQQAELPILEYTYYTAVEQGPSFTNEEDDVVTKFVEDKFKIKVKEVYFNQGMTFKERLNLFIATNEVPDVVATVNDNVTVPSTGRFAQIGDLIKENCPNLLEWYPEEEWKDTLYNGEMYVYPSLFIDGSHPKFKDDIYVSPFGNWAGIWTKESVLKKLGYQFTPLADIYKMINDTGKKPSPEDFKIEPAIATPDDFYNFLKKIKETMPKVDGKDVIPFSMPIWLEPHFGAAFGLTGNWKWNPDTNKVSQFLGDENAKAYWQFMNKLYKEGLLDKDFSIQKQEMLQEKAVQGRLASFLWVPSATDVQTAMKKTDPQDTLRQIPLPIKPGSGYVGIDGVSKATFKVFINKDFKDIPRLLKYFDWFQTIEARDLQEWGPESLGLWEMKDGKKVWKDEALHKALLEKDTEYLKANYYSKGLGDNGTWKYSKAFACVPLMTTNLADWKRSYPYIVDANDFNYQSGYVSGIGIDWLGRIASPVDDVTKLAVDFTYGEFEQQHSAKLFAARTDEEFEKNWNEVMKYFNEKMKYDESKKRMEIDFKMKGFDVK